MLLLPVVCDSLVVPTAGVRALIRHQPMLTTESETVKLKEKIISRYYYYYYYVHYVTCFGVHGDRCHDDDNKYHLKST